VFDDKLAEKFRATREERRLGAQQFSEAPSTDNAYRCFGVCLVRWRIDRCKSLSPAMLWKPESA
jgi:hypothetical protein